MGLVVVRNERWLLVRPPQIAYVMIRRRIGLRHDWRKVLRMTFQSVRVLVLVFVLGCWLIWMLWALLT